MNLYGGQHEYTLFHATLEPLPSTLEATEWEIIQLPRYELIPRLSIELALMSLARIGWLNPLKLLPPHRKIQDKNLGLMLYVKPTIHTFLWDHTFAFPIHDLQHLLQPEFPEVSAGGEWARREFMYRNAVPKASAILTDSEVGRDDVVQAYKANPNKIHPLPYLAPTYLSSEVTNEDIQRVQGQYKLPKAFLFYPSAFWPHKNHGRLLQAIYYLRNRYKLNLDLVLAGGLRHEYERLKRLSAELGISDKIHFIGYVPDEDIYPLYHLAFALVMPTFFGPTNIPFLEAWSLGCPVITSDIRGIREQIEDAGLLANPREPEDIARAIHRLYRDSNLRDQIIERGRAKFAEWTPIDFANRLEAIMEQCVHLNQH
ncbi:glycosyltransferase family 4 protein [Candidatus Pacearchaeota archaeon]|nr:glycosyltransferase family 4 protein [Candidatus Pacearchaeota archaeon]